MTFRHQRRRMVVVRRRRILAGKRLRAPNSAIDAGDDGAEKRQGNDGFVHC